MNRKPDAIGEYTELYLGNPRISGHVDAPHASNWPIPRELMERYLYSGRFQANMEGVTWAPKKGKLYLNAALRRRLGITGNEGGIQIGDRSFAVDTGRRRVDDDTLCPILCHEEERAVVIPFLCEALRGKAEVKTADIVRRAVQEGVSGIIATVDRETADLNRLPKSEGGPGSLFPAIQATAFNEYRRHKRSILDATGYMKNRRKSRPYLQIGVHGKKNPLDGRSDDAAIEIGTRHDETCDFGVRRFFENRLRHELAELGANPDIRSNIRLIGDPALGDGRRIFGPSYHGIQLEISRQLRMEMWPQFGVILADILKEFSEMSVEALKYKVQVRVNRALKGSPILEVSPEYAQEHGLKDGDEVSWKEL